ncbi:MAG: amidase [Rhodobacteraceae bacterium]|nr:amidase [Paracoccaceae bacterium]
MNVQAAAYTRVEGLWPDAVALRAAMQQGKVTAREALDACLQVIDDRNELINAVVYQDRDGARVAADACDRADAPVGPLHGVPVTLKECFDWQGHPTTWGDPARGGHVAAADSAVAAGLKRAGAVIIGKTNIPAYLSDWETANPLFGVTCNPHNLNRSAGGSSGGSAAAVATGMSYIDIGSDQGGSIRFPAHNCGVHGLKPSWNSISLRGHSPFGDLREPDIGTAGPLARSAWDISLAFEVLSGQGSIAPVKTEGLRIAVIPVPDECPIDHEYAQLLRTFAGHLQSKGATISEAAPAIDFVRATEVMNLLVRAETVHKSELALAFRAGPDASVAGRSFAELNKRGNSLSHRDWLSLHEERLRMCQAWAEFFELYDLALFPAAAGEAAPLRPHRDVTERTVPVNGREEPILKQHMLHMPGSLCYLPAHVLPVGRSDAGLPLGVQVIGGHRQDQYVLAAVQGFEGFGVSNRDKK